MSKLPSKLAEEGKITPSEGDGRSCANCGKPVYEYLWSPLFCPECDKKRMDRIDKGIRYTSNQFEEE